MVSLSTAYGLCSLIDQSGFLHVSGDEDDCALVTLGRNIVIRYRLSDQKQLNNWSTIPQLTSKVVYDPIRKSYFGIFTENVIKQWNTDNIDLDKVSKIKLKDAGHEILIDDEPIILYKSGACCSIESVRDKNHETTKGFLPEDAKILYAKLVTNGVDKYIVIIAVAGKNQTTCYSVRLNQGDCKPILPTLKTVKLRRRNHELLGCCFINRENGDNLITLWSDRFLYTLPLPLLSEQYDLPIGQFKGVLRSINASLPVAMTSLSAQHLAIYGGDPGEEGAVLAVYNLEFGMVQASTSFKLMQKPPRVWAIHERLLVGLGQRLICVPYTLQTDSMAALVGTRPLQSENQQNEVVTVMPTVVWEETPEQKMPTIDMEIQATIDSFASQGCSESRICEALITQLLEKNDVSKLIWCLEEFVDIPEPLLVRLLHYAFIIPDSAFASELVNGEKRSKKRKSKKGVTDDSVNLNPISPSGRAEFLNHILRAAHNPEALVPALRTGLPLSEALTLLQYFAYELSAGSSRLEHAIIEWAITVVDAFYQQLVLGRYANCVKSVMELRDKVEEKVQTLNDCHDLLPLVLRLRNRQQTPFNPMQSKSYSIQKIQLYH